MIKPFPSTFRFVVHDIGVKPRNVLLIDDSWYNIVASRLFGWRAIWFKDLHSLELIESKFTPVKSKISKRFKKQGNKIKLKINEEKSRIRASGSKIKKRIKKRRIKKRN
jgi:beta-phosphoglucomutase-like phosphatase (HAD superfamily)